jgi:hypothetical protein
LIEPSVLRAAKAYLFDAGGSGAPSENVYTKIYSNEGAFAALKADRSITSWGSGSANAPSDSGYTDIYSTAYAFAALKVDGSITAWGNSGYGGTGAPKGACVPPLFGSPHTLIEPSVLRAAKAYLFE